MRLDISFLPLAGIPPIQLNHRDVGVASVEKMRDRPFMRLFARHLDDAAIGIALAVERPFASVKPIPAPAGNPRKSPVFRPKRCRSSSVVFATVIYDH
jgi:hypothetical protein